MKKTTAIGLAILTATFCSAGSAFAAETIKIGVYNCLTGQNAFAGQLELEGTRLAHKEMPEVLGKTVELIVVDNKSDKVEAANAVARLIEMEKVVAIIGTYGSSLAMAGGEVAEKSRIPVVGTSCTNPLVTVGKKYYFRTCFNDTYQGAGAATYAYKNLGYTKAALLTDIAADSSVGQANFFKKSFLELGGTIVCDMKYQSGDQDFTAQLTEIASRKPDMVFLPAYFAEGAIVLKQARELGLTCAFIGSDAMDNPEIVTLGGEAVEGFLHTTFAYDPTMTDMNPVAKQFTESWYKQYPGKNPNALAALGYDSYFLLMEAIKQAGKAEPEAIRDALEKVRGLQTVTGVTTINADHDAEKDLGVVEIKGGKRIFIGIVKPEV